MKPKIKLNKIGKIKGGDYLDWYVEVIDDTNGKTGGFYIIISKNYSEKGDGYNSWFENFNDVEEYFIEATWIVDWEIH